MRCCNTFNTFRVHLVIQDISIIDKCCIQDGKDISKMPIEYAPKFTKEYNKDICDELGIKIPDGYEAIETEETAE